MEQEKSNASLWPHVQHATTEIAKHMPKLHEHHRHLLRRWGRYLKKTPRFIQKFECLDKIIDVTGCSGSDWVGDLVVRKSTSGGAFVIGIRTVKA